MLSTSELINKSQDYTNSGLLNIFSNWKNETKPLEIFFCKNLLRGCLLYTPALLIPGYLSSKGV